MKVKTSIKSIIIFFVAFLFICACNKYEENEGISLRSKKARIVGTWKIEKIISDNKSDNYIDSLNKIEIKINSDGYFSYQNDLIENFIGWWYLNEDKTALNFSAETNVYSNGSPAYNYWWLKEWEILKLTKDELWLDNETEVWQMKKQ